ncbi:MAG: CYTH domain-containing protein [Acidobacteriota bacterium]
MAVEIEKKYRLSKKQRTEVLARLPKIGAKRKREEFEVNMHYAGDGLDVGCTVLRLRRIGKRGILTYKKRFPTRSDTKHREDETSVDDPDALELLLEALGFTPGLIFKSVARPGRWAKAEIVIDKLPFGLFMEIEGSEQDIRDIESKLSIKRLRTKSATHPQLNLIHGFLRRIGQPRPGAVQG